MSVGPNETSSHDLSQEVASARKQARADGSAPLDYLCRSYPDHQELCKLLSEQAGMWVWGDPPRDESEWQPDFSVWPRQQAESSRALILHDKSGARLLAMEDPWNEGTVQAAADAIHTWPNLVVVNRQQMNMWLGGQDSGQQVAVGSASDASTSVVAFVDNALRQGFRAGASDVHFECDRSGVTVRIRMDGVMNELSRLNGGPLAQQAISRIKVLAALDITERRVPQDGRMRLDVGDAVVDLRTSIMPSIHGEDAVLRLLDKAQWRGQTSVSLDSLGFDASAAADVRLLASQPSGMLLITGPTGSGKTTTVYAALSEINTGTEKIVTIEDPVEYELPGVLQIPVNERKGLTFAKGLRSILRHDPDRILVGEIRDAETAEIAVQSALTGHQVFTTVHANGIGDVIGRFRHFDIDMFGLMSALNGIVVQRLIRRLCKNCLQFQPLSSDDASWARRQDCSLTQAAVPIGCPVCRETGYRGRFVIAEIHFVDDALRDLVTTGAPLSMLRAHASGSNVQSILSQAASHVTAGRTSIAEVRRVVGGLA